MELMVDQASGLSRVEDIREAEPGLPVILASGLRDSIGRIMLFGVEAWIDKPFPLGEVRAAVKKVLGSKDGEGRERRAILC